MKKVNRNFPSPSGKVHYAQNSLSTTASTKSLADAFLKEKENLTTLGTGQCRHSKMKSAQCHYWQAAGSSV